jgi:probable F420-dependent oxidoreductase
VTAPYRFSVQSLDFGNREALVGLARRAEALGYDELCTAVHVGAPDPLAPLLVAAEATTSLRLGPLVLNNELHHPVLLARWFATADQLSGGRMILGIGTGYQQSEHDAAGIELRPPPRRVERLEESLLVLRSLLDDGRASFAGQHHTIEVDDLGTRPVQAKVPFLIGGNGRQVVGIAGRHADIFQFTGLIHGPGGTPAAGAFDLDSLRQRARWLAEAAGERDDQIERSALVQSVQVGGNVEDQVAEIVERTGLDRSTIEETPFAMVGSVEQLVDKIERRRRDLGITHYVIRDAEMFAPVKERLT